MSVGRPPSTWPGSCANTGSGSERAGTRRDTRALGVVKQSAIVLRWFIDGTRLTQLARDNGISERTAYRFLHEGLTVLADLAPDPSTARERATAAGYTHLNLGGTSARGRQVDAPLSSTPRQQTIE